MARSLPSSPRPLCPFEGQISLGQPQRPWAALEASGSANRVGEQGSEGHWRLQGCQMLPEAPEATSGPRGWGGAKAPECVWDSQGFLRPQGGPVGWGEQGPCVWGSQGCGRLLRLPEAPGWGGEGEQWELSFISFWGVPTTCEGQGEWGSKGYVILVFGSPPPVRGKGVRGVILGVWVPMTFVGIRGMGEQGVHYTKF